MNHSKNKAAATLPLVRCAIYTRKSTEEGLEQEFNSLDAQREAAEAFIRSQTHENSTTIIPHSSRKNATVGSQLTIPLIRFLAEC
ncbi:MAG TPA: recombinase family protein [Gemmataceae bacterium]|jgi:hypothetical protein